MCADQETDLALLCFTTVTTAPVKRKSAFERLGKEEESDVSKHMERLSPKIRITKLSKSPVTAPASKMVSLVKVCELSLSYCSNLLFGTRKVVTKA